MGLDIGLEAAGFEAAVCVEIDKAAVQTIKTNRPRCTVLAKSIRELSGNEIARAGSLEGKELPLVVGGPPCQAFSVIGNRGGLNDDRGQLLFEFLRMIRELNPQTFLMENVRNLLKK
jgi:DNA (cytosine-5)-methyltransferase 1